MQNNEIEFHNVKLSVSEYAIFVGSVNVGSIYVDYDYKSSVVYFNKPNNWSFNKNLTTLEEAKEYVVALSSRIVIDCNDKLQKYCDDTFYDDNGIIDQLENIQKALESLKAKNPKHYEALCNAAIGTGEMTLGDAESALDWALGYLVMMDFEEE